MGKLAAAHVASLTSSAPVSPSASCYVTVSFREALGTDETPVISEVMEEAPAPTDRTSPRRRCREPEEQARPWVVVTSLSGCLLGVARPEQIHAAAGDGGG